MFNQFIRLIINRNFKKNKFHTFLNILGLAVGLSAFILIMMFVQHERNYDRFHSNYKDIYRIVCDKESGKWSGTPALLGSYLKERVPEIDHYVRVEEREDIMVFHEDERFYEKNLIYSEKAFFEVFDFRIIRGNQEDPLEAINSIVITERMAEKYFGKEDPIGKTLELTEKKEPFTITAVAANPPTNSSIRFNFILSFEVFDKNAYWGEFNYTTYLQLDHQDKEEAEHKIHKIGVERSDHTMDLDFLRLQPMKDMRFEPIRGNTFNTLDRKYIFIYFSAAFFVLLLAAINYTNLT